MQTPERDDVSQAFVVDRTVSHKLVLKVRGAVTRKPAYKLSRQFFKRTKQRYALHIRQQVIRAGLALVHLR